MFLGVSMLLIRLSIVSGRLMVVYVGFRGFA